MNKNIELFLNNWEEKALLFYENVREDYIQNKSNMAYIELQDYICNKYGKGNYIIIKDKYKEIKTIVEKEKNKKYNALIKAIDKKTGGIIEIISLNIDNKSGNLNGVIVGNNGKFEIDTVYAGGYNVQCLHFRTLIKRCK